MLCGFRGIWAGIGQCGADYQPNTSPFGPIWEKLVACRLSGHTFKRHRVQTPVFDLPFVCPQATVLLTLVTLWGRSRGPPPNAEPQTAKLNFVRQERQARRDRPLALAACAKRHAHGPRNARNAPPARTPARAPAYERLLLTSNSNSPSSPMYRDAPDQTNRLQPMPRHNSDSRPERNFGRPPPPAPDCGSANTCSTPSRARGGPPGRTQCTSITHTPGAAFPMPHAPSLTLAMAGAAGQPAYTSPSGSQITRAPTPNSRVPPVLCGCPGHELLELGNPSKSAAACARCGCVPARLYTRISNRTEASKPDVHAYMLPICYTSCWPNVPRDYMLQALLSDCRRLSNRGWGKRPGDRNGERKVWRHCDSTPVNNCVEPRVLSNARHSQHVASPTDGANDATTPFVRIDHRLAPLLRERGFLARIGQGHIFRNPHRPRLEKRLQRNGPN